MKKYIITFLLLFCALICTAQENKSFDKAEWKHIKELCASRPDSIRNLVKTLLNGVTKSPLTTAKSQLIYIGQSYISQGKEEKVVQEMLKALIKGNTDKAITYAQQALAINPISLPAIIFMGREARNMVENGNNSPINVEAEAYYRRIATCVLDAISSTGDGTISHPFVITSEEDARFFMHYQLRLKGEKRAKRTGNRLDFDLSCASDRYNRSTISFDITRVIELQEQPKQ